MGKPSGKEKHLLVLRKNKYIGGEFSSADFARILLRGRLKPVSVCFPPQIGDLSRSYLESGADSIAFILSKKKESSLVLWVPENFCYKSLHRVSIKLRNKVLTIRKYSTFSSIKAVKDVLNIVLITHFNAYNAQNLSDGVESSHVEIIEDFTHAPLDITKSSGDHSFCSLRKFIPASVSVTYSKAPPIEGASGNKSAYLRLKTAAAEIKASVQEDPTYSEESSYLQIFKLAEEQLSNGHIHAAHSTQVRMVERIDFDKALKIRISNHDFLLDKLKNNELITGIVPGEYMYFTILTDHQQLLRKHFFEHGIFPAIHWLDSDSYLSKKLLSFHIDHRYNSEDMGRIKKVMESFRKE